MTDKHSEAAAILAGLAFAMQRAGLAKPEAIERLTGGATMESWRFTSGGLQYVLRRAPSDGFMDDRPFGHAAEAAIIEAARAAGVTAPEVIAQLLGDDGIGSGFVMRALPGTPDPRAILAMDDPDGLLTQIAQDLARTHSINAAALPRAVPTLDYRDGIKGLADQFEEAGGDRPILALGLRWLMDNVPQQSQPVLNHGDYRLGNLLVEDSKLTGVLDWELAHFGDFHEDLAFGCMAVWRFARYDRPALGLGSLEQYFAAYEAASGRKVDAERFRFWTIYRTVWWALGCLKMAAIWRSGEDRMLERVVISRRTSEQELDLLMLLEEEAPWRERRRQLPPHKQHSHPAQGEAGTAELATAISEWLGTVKDRMAGHDRFQLAVARNALGIIARESDMDFAVVDSPELAQDFLSGRRTLRNKVVLSDLKFDALEFCSIDSPKYPALAVARKKWTGDN